MKRIYFFIAALLAVGAVTSCSSSDTEESSGNTSPANVILNLKAGGTVTRTLAALPSTSDDITKDEGKVNSYNVGLFDKSYKTVTITDESSYSANAGDAKQGDVSIPTTTQSRHVCLVANIPAIGSYTSATDTSSYRKIQVALNKTTSSDGKSSNESIVNSQLPTALPMYGESDLTAFDASTLKASATVELKRIVARISVSSIETSFSSTPYAGATFVPKEIFMFNVNDLASTDGSRVGQNSGIIDDNTSTPASGKCEMTTGTTCAQLTPLTSYAYLSSGEIKKYSDDATTYPAGDQKYISTSDNPYFFYVFRHYQTNPTKVVVKGLFYNTAADFSNKTNAEVIYYPIVVNHWQTGVKINGNNSAPSDDSQIIPNTAYDIAITIKGKGMTSPNQNIAPSSASVTMKVAPWTVVTQSNVIN